MNLFCLFSILVCLLPHYPTYIDAPISQEFGYKNHTGVDFSVDVGSDVYAILDGVVIEEYNNARAYGRYIMIEHYDGNASLYAHLSKFKVKVGDRVKAGELIALSGGDPNDNIDGDGLSSGAHLHLEVRTIGHLDNSLYNIDPIKYINNYDEVCHNERMK